MNKQGGIFVVTDKKEKAQWKNLANELGFQYLEKPRAHEQFLIQVGNHWASVDSLMIATHFSMSSMTCLLSIGFVV